MQLVLSTILCSKLLHSPHLLTHLSSSITTAQHTHTPLPGCRRENSSIRWTPPSSTLPGSPPPSGFLPLDTQERDRRPVLCSEANPPNPVLPTFFLPRVLFSVKYSYSLVLFHQHFIVLRFLPMLKQQTLNGPRISLIPM